MRQMEPSDLHPITFALRRGVSELWPASVAILGVITANQEQVEWWLRMIALVGSIVATGLGVYRFFKPASPRSSRR